MRTCIVLILLIIVPCAALAGSGQPANQSLHFMSFAGHKAREHRLEQGVPRYALNPETAPANGFGMQPIQDNALMATFMVDRLEYQSREGKDTLLWDVQAWAGRDYNKLWFKSEGTWLLDRQTVEEVATELFYSRTIARFWDLQAGIRHDFKPDPDRSFAAFGLQGLAPYWFETEATGYLSEDGDLSLAVEAEYDLLLTQRLILQPRFETGFAVQKVEEYGVGQGINDIGLGVRLRYEILREFAPYLGVSWGRKLGETADLAEAEGEEKDIVSFVLGVKLWF